MKKAEEVGVTEEEEGEKDNKVVIKNNYDDLCQKMSVTSMLQLIACAGE